MAIEFTHSQKRIIESRNRNLLVSAAAGSGKTAVLVERIIRLITDKEHPVDIDRLLVVTFTEAAAGEMKERVDAAIQKRLEKEPENQHLIRQATLVHHAQITTIHSFCLFVIRNNFNDIGLDPGFRVGDPGELELIKQDVLKELFEEKLQNSESREDFSLLLETMAAGGTEKVLEELIITLHRFSESCPWPKHWLRQHMEDYHLPESGIEDTVWRKELTKTLNFEWEQIREALEKAISLCRQEDGPALYEEALSSDLELLNLLSKKNYSEQYQLLQELKYVRLSSKKQEGVDEAKKEAVKTIRDQVKKDITGIAKKYFSVSPGGIKERMRELERVERILLQTVLEFSERFLAQKREKNLIDFSDMEHLALEILTERKKEGERGEITWIPSKTAIDYRGYFKEIMIDEYQDSNMVQEYLLQSISGEWEGNYNRFMVGDLKQSIYRFRMARPEIFLEKYNTYTEEESNQQCILLHQNFRSRRQVLDSVNGIFEKIMTREIGKIDYTEKEALYPGAQYDEGVEPGDYTTELLLLDKPQKDGRKAEAQMVAQRIHQLVGSLKIKDKETGELRNARYHDVVILLRSNTGWDEVFFQELSGAGIPAVLTSRTGYFHAKEVQTVLNFLRVIDNPLQDIPLYGVMTSLLGRFTKEEISQITALGKRRLYDNLVQAANALDSLDEKLTEKAGDFLYTLNRYRDKVAIIPIHRLIREYLQETGYLYYFAALPGGSQKTANVRMLMKKAEAYEKTSYFGLFHFIRYMEQLQKYEVDMGEAALGDEGQDAVRIMSIHKSKGLEFPVCFICGLHKRFNKKDSQQACIMDIDLGLGLEYRNPQKRIRSIDIRKSVIARKMELENLGEELRVLYVAMTRAKEKLIMTGLVEMEKYEKQLSLNSSSEEYGEGRLPFYILTHGNSYLDYLLAVIWHSHPPIRVIPWDEKKEETKEKGRAVQSELMRMELEERLNRAMRKEKMGEEAGADHNLLANLKETLSFTYHHPQLQGLYAKTTVSELKKKTMRLAEESGEGSWELFTEEEIIPYIPRFMEKEKSVAPTTRGTAYHRVLELIDFSRLSDWDSLYKEMQEYERRGILDPAYLPLIQKKRMEPFLSSLLADRMKEADRNQLLFKEKPFVLGLPASLLDERFPDTQKVLIQGIIDAFFEEKGELVLVDYKTDRISQGEELIRRYSSQLSYYQKALEQLTGKPVKEKLLYSFALGKVISCP